MTEQKPSQNKEQDNLRYVKQIAHAFTLLFFLVMVGVIAFWVQTQHRGFSPTVLFAAMLFLASLGILTSNLLASIVGTSTSSILPKNWWIRFIFILYILTILGLFALFAWQIRIAPLLAHAGPSKPPSQAPVVSSPPPPACGLGGPYGYRGGKRKVEEFENYKDKELYFSSGAQLTNTLLNDSVEEEQQVSRPTKSKKLKYNYVISTEDCQIYVAVWIQAHTDVPIHVVKRAVCDPLPTKGPGGPDQVKSYQFKAKPNLMINWFLEDSINKPRDSPCWVDDGKNRETGILDALSKHFMLSQKLGNQSIQNIDLKPGSADNATLRSVGYAGEIEVDLRMCRYIINPNSGTYLPDPGKLREVVDFFEAELNILPDNRGTGGQITKCNPSP
jgi:hypothetical protein